MKYILPDVTATFTATITIIEPKIFAGLAVIVFVTNQARVSTSPNSRHIVFTNLGWQHKLPDSSLGRYGFFYGCNSKWLRLDSRTTGLGLQTG